MGLKTNILVKESLLKHICLTGIKPTGSLHLGNYFAAIKPMLEMLKKHKSFVFIADYHAITTLKDASLLKHYNLEAAATWLALGLDPEKVVFYRQSDVPEIFELHWILSCFATKGLLNRAHAYKSLVDVNAAAGRDVDEGVNLGLFSYPVLMAADILAMQATTVPVGKDQQQHVEIARDIAETFNAQMKADLVLPQQSILKEVSTLPGIDGRKMSKNYNNTIPIFGEAKQIRKRIMQIKTDSKEMDEPKDSRDCIISQLYELVVSESEWQSIRENYEAGGVGYGHHKQAFFEALQGYFSEAQAKYTDFMAKPDEIELILAQGAKKARMLAKQTLEACKQSVGFA